MEIISTQNIIVLLAYQNMCIIIKKIKKIMKTTRQNYNYNVTSNKGICMKKQIKTQKKNMQRL